MTGRSRIRNEKARPFVQSPENQVEVTVGLVRAVEIGRLRKFSDVALRCRVAYSLEHYFRSRQLWPQEKQAKDSLGQWMGIIA